MKTKTTTRHLPRAKRLYLILERINCLHLRRRVRGKDNTHLQSRSYRLTQAYLESASN